MNDVTDEQQAAFEWLLKQMIYNPHARSLLAMLPDALTNPHPALPTEPGLYLASNRVVLELEDGQWTLPGMSTVDNPSGHGLPFARLVPERPQVTREQLNRACLAEEVAAVNFRQARAILNFVNGTRA